MTPTATSVRSAGVMAKPMCRPAACSSRAHSMKRAKPASVLGGGDMNRVTSSTASIDKSDGASAN